MQGYRSLLRSMKACLPEEVQLHKRRLTNHLIKGYTLLIPPAPVHHTRSGRQFRLKHVKCPKGRPPAPPAPPAEESDDEVLLILPP